MCLHSVGCELYRAPSPVRFTMKRLADNFEAKIEKNETGWACGAYG